MYIKTENTPNPDSIKFLPGCNINNQDPLYFERLEDTNISNLAKDLMSITHIKSVFFGKNFITVTKEKNGLWEILKQEIILTITNYIQSGAPIFNNITKKNNISDIKNIPEIEKQIMELIDKNVRPAVAMDGGDITYVSFTNGIVKLKLKGACSGCPSASITLKNGIESMLKHYIPEIISVEAIDTNQTIL